MLSLCFCDLGNRSQACRNSLVLSRKGPRVMILESPACWNLSSFSLFCWHFLEFLESTREVKKKATGIIFIQHTQSEWLVPHSVLEYFSNQTHAWVNTIHTKTQSRHYVVVSIQGLCDLHVLLFCLIFIYPTPTAPCKWLKIIMIYKVFGCSLFHWPG